MAAISGSGATFSPISASFSSNRQNATYSAFSGQIHMKYNGRTMVTYCAKKERAEKLKLEDMSLLYSGSISDKKRSKLLESLSVDLSTMNAALQLEAHQSLRDQVRRQILEGALDVLRKQLEQARREYRKRKQRLKTTNKKAAPEGPTANKREEN